MIGSNCSGFKLIRIQFCEMPFCLSMPLTRIESRRPLQHLRWNSLWTSKLLQRAAPEMIQGFYIPFGPLCNHQCSFVPQLQLRVVSNVLFKCSREMRNNCINNENRTGNGIFEEGILVVCRRLESPL